MARTISIKASLGVIPVSCVQYLGLKFIRPSHSLKYDRSWIKITVFKTAKFGIDTVVGGECAVSD